jgi:hypothetical protein
MDSKISHPPISAIIRKNAECGTKKEECSDESSDQYLHESTIIVSSVIKTESVWSFVEHK